MEIKVNKEVRDYTESIFLGLSFRQFLFSIIACVVAVIIYLSCVDVLGMETTFQKMNAEELLITAWHSFLLSNRNLIDKPFNLYYEMFKDVFDKQIKEALGKNDKKLFKIKKTKQRKI